MAQCSSPDRAETEHAWPTMPAECARVRATCARGQGRRGPPNPFPRRQAAALPPGDSPRAGRELAGAVSAGADRWQRIVHPPLAAEGLAPSLRAPGMRLETLPDFLGEFSSGTLSVISIAVVPRAPIRVCPGHGTASPYSKELPGQAGEFLPISGATQ